MSDTRYNGWTNRQTWNIALWIGNDEGLYSLARDITQQCSDDDSPYERFATEMRELGCTETPDHVAYNDSALDIDELDSMM